MAPKVPHIDYTDLSVRLVRMIDRFQEYGTLTRDI